MQEREPLFSIVTVCLNAGGQLLKTAESVLSQNFNRFEYIVKDGGSSDGSLGRCPSNPRMRAVVAPDTGIYDAMNEALPLCRGGYVLFLNAGDVLAGPDVLSAVATCVEASGWPEVVYTHARVVSGQYVQRYPPKLTKFLLYRRPVCHQATYVRRDCFTEMGKFDTGFRLAADYDHLARLVVRHKRRAVLCSIVGTEYDGSGISAELKYRPRLRQEVRQVRRRNFVARDRVAYGIAWQLTMPWLRQAVSNGRLGRRAQRAYLALTGRSSRATGPVHPAPRDS